MHKIRNSLKYIVSKDQKSFLTDLKKVYQANTRNEAENNLLELRKKWVKKYPLVIKSWENNWPELPSVILGRSEAKIRGSRKPKTNNQKQTKNKQIPKKNNKQERVPDSYVFRKNSFPSYNRHYEALERQYTTKLGSNYFTVSYPFSGMTKFRLVNKINPY